MPKRSLALLNEPLWLPRHEVINTNLDAVTVTGEQHALLFPDNLDNALAVPRNKFAYENVEDIVALYVSLLFALARAHAFEQGNKRTALTSANIFLNSNGYEMTFEDREGLAELIIGVVENWMDERTFTDFIRDYVQVLDP